jgi:acyltransferase-like protein
MTGRDRSIDAARAAAIVGVVAGHWLVTGLVPGPDGVATASPLTAMPALAPAGWLLQTLGLLFFAGGYAAARRGRTSPPDPDRGARREPASTSHTDRDAHRTPGPRRGLGRLARPVLVLLAGLGLTLLAGAALGVPATTLRTIARLTASPLWFLLPYLALHLATGPLRRLVHRTGAAAVLPLIATVTATDLGLLPGPVAVLAAWAIPWILGLVLAAKDDAAKDDAARDDAARDDVRTPWPAGTWVGAALACWGAAALAALILLAGYPSSAVGVPGAGRSNLDPPSLLAVALAVTQIGVFLLLRRPLSRLLRHEAAYRPIAALNRAAVPVYLGHQVTLLALAGLAALVDPAMPGLLTAPDGARWVVDRVAWLPVLAVVLGGFRHAEPDYLRRGLRGTLFDGSRARTTSGGDRCAR